MLANLYLRAISFLNLRPAQGNIVVISPSTSQTTKSIMVKQPKYHPSYGQSFSQSLRMGSMRLPHTWSSLPWSSWYAQISPSMALFKSCLLFMLSMRTLSARLRPSISLFFAFSTMYNIIAAGPVTTKLPSLTKGRSRTVHSLASPSLNLLHSSGVKNRSTQSMCRYSHNNLGSCTFERTGQYPTYSRTVKPSSSSRLQGRMQERQYYFFLAIVKDRGKGQWEICQQYDMKMSQQKWMLLLWSSSKRRTLKLRLSVMNGSTGSSSKYSKPLQYSYQSSEMSFCWSVSW